MADKFLILYYVGQDSYARPVYENGEKLFVDVCPVKDKEPEIRTKYGNVFNGEPDTPIKEMSKYKDVRVEFSPERITWY